MRPLVPAGTTGAADRRLRRHWHLACACAVLCGPQCVAADGERLCGGDGLGDGGIDGVGALAVLAVDEQHGVAVCGRLDCVGCGRGRVSVANFEDDGKQRALAGTLRQHIRP